MKMILGGVFLFAAALGAGHVQAAACSNGVSGGFACSHIEFVGHLSPAELGGSGERLNDIWGWVDPASNEEYAIVGMYDGTAFVRINADGSLTPLGRLAASDGQANVRKASPAGKQCHDELCGSEESAWRDVKVYSRNGLHYAFIVSEADYHGLQIFDLTQLAAANAPMQWSQTVHYKLVGHAHNIFINEDTARAYVVGHDRPEAGVAGGLHVLDISTPTNPVLLAELNADGYTHDVQCVVYHGPDGNYGGRELCFASNEDTLTVWDVTDVDVNAEAGAEILSRTAYSQSGYTHQGWLSEDHRYFFLNDELDETNTGSRTHLRVFDVSDVDNPQLAAEYFAPTLAIDHNNYVHGRWLYQSNYAAGLRILDVLDPEHPVEAAYFDPQPSDNPDFHGTWSNFAFPSGHVAFTDINGGLYVVKPTLVEGAAEPDLSATMTLDASQVNVDAALNGEFVLTNGAAADAADVLVTLHLPDGAIFSDVNEPANWRCAEVSGGRVVECRGANVAASSEAVFAFAITPSISGSMEAIGMAYANEADAAPGDNLDRATFTAQASGGSGGGDSGGGGGALAWLIALLLLPALRRHAPHG